VNGGLCGVSGPCGVSGLSGVSGPCGVSGFSGVSGVGGVTLACEANHSVCIGGMLVV
jgi:hypothetical protein